MRSDSKRSWWRRRRVQWPAGALLVLVLAAAWAAGRADASRVVVYNDTGGAISSLGISACGESQSFRAVGPRASVVFEPAGRGEGSDVLVVAEGFPPWRGAYLEPRGGCRAVVRLRRDGEVECRTSTTWWRTLLHPNFQANPDES